MYDSQPGLNRYKAWLTPDYPGNWQFFVRAWSDPYATWLHDARIKLEYHQDVQLVFQEAEVLLKRAVKGVPARSDEASALRDAIDVVSKKRITPAIRFAAATSTDVEQALEKYPLRDLVTESARYPLAVDRERALVGSWYEIFPRSIGATFDEETNTWTSGTLRTAQADLDRIADMGFDVVYMPPLSPIGTTNKKGKNNSLEATEADPGSPYAIGSADGGHDAIHPDLGTFADFDAFVARAEELGLEVAVDLALQCSPDHPWLTELTFASASEEEDNMDETTRYALDEMRIA